MSYALKHTPLPPLLRGIATKTGKTCTARFLTERDLHAIMALQALILADLQRSGHGNFIVPKDEAHFCGFLESHGRMVGLFDGDTLVAQAIFGLPHGGETDVGVLMTLPAPAEQLAVLRGVLVHSAYRGNHFMRVLCGLWLDTMTEHGRTHAVAEVAVENPYSWRVMQDMGLAIVEAGEDPDDGCQLYYLHLPPTGPVAGGPATVFFRPMDELPLQRTLLMQGYAGMAYVNGFVGYARRR